MSKSILSALATKFMRHRPSEDGTPLSSTDEIWALMESVRETTISLRHDYTGSATSFSHLIASVADKIAVLYPAVATIHQSYVEASQRSAVLEKSNRQLESKLRIASEDLALQKNAVADGERRIDLFAAENSSLKEEVNALEAELGKYRGAQETLELELRSERRRIADSEENGRAQQTRLSNREAELYEARHKMAKLTNDFADAKLSAELKQKSLENLSVAFSEVQAANSKSEALLVHSRHDLQTLRRTLHEKEKESEATRARDEAEIERLKAENQEFGLANVGLQSRVKTLEKIVKSQREKVESSAAHIAHLQSALRRLLAEKTDEVFEHERDLVSSADVSDVHDNGAGDGESPDANSSSEGPSIDRSSESAQVVHLLSGGIKKS